MKELPILDAIQKKAGSDRIYVVAINLKESRRQFRKALRVFEDFEIEFIHDWRGTVANRYGVKGIPNMLILDVDGSVAFKHIGYNEDDLEGIIKDINSLLIKNNLASHN